MFNRWATLMKYRLLLIPHSFFYCFPDTALMSFKRFTHSIIVKPFLCYLKWIILDLMSIFWHLFFFCYYFISFLLLQSKGITLVCWNKKKITHPAKFRTNNILNCSYYVSYCLHSHILIHFKLILKRHHNANLLFRYWRTKDILHLALKTWEMMLNLSCVNTK